jgi:hypothetical protein
MSHHERDKWLHGVQGAEQTEGKMMVTQQRKEPSTKAMLIGAGVFALILTAAFGGVGLAIGAVVFILVAIGSATGNKTPALERTTAVAVPIPVTQRPRKLSAAGRVQVVGESHYQHAIAQVAGGRSTYSLEDAIAAIAVLVPEPHNPHDRNAVRVDLMRSDGYAVTAGYLAREDAARYQPALLTLAQQGEIGTCPTRIMGGGQRFYGVHLHLGAPERVLLVNNHAAAATPTAEVLPAEHLVTVTGEEEHQDVLSRFVNPQVRQQTSVLAELRNGEITKGKHVGEQTLEVLVDGNRVGQLTYAMGQRYGALVNNWRAANGHALCEAVVSHEGTRGLQVQLLLPR